MAKSNAKFTNDQTAKFWSVVLTEKDYEGAIIKLNLAGIEPTGDLDKWLRSYYKAEESFDATEMLAPDFPEYDSNGLPWTLSIAGEFEKP